MGCDIHIVAEVKENGIWKQNTLPVFKNPYYKPEEKDKSKEDQWKSALHEFNAEPSSSRNYDWFAILADVRNGRGFAGVKTGEGFEVIAMPRDIPEDCSDETKKFFCMPVATNPELENEEDEDGNYYVSENSANSWIEREYSKEVNIEGKRYVTNPDYHSSSFLTVKDFDDFDWNQKSRLTGIIPLNIYEKLRGTNESPESWNGFIEGPNIVTVDMKTADKILRDKELGIDSYSLYSKMVVYVSYEWEVEYKEWFKHQIENTVEPLRTLKEKYEDARIVFSFDN